MTGIQKILLRLYPLVRRIVPDRHLPWPLFGGRIYLNLRESIMMYQRALGAYEASKVRLVRTLLRPGMSFLDVGANKGYFSLLAASIAGDSARIVAIEPEPTNCEWLRRTLPPERYPMVDVLEVAVGATQGRTQLYLGEKSGWHSLVGAADQPSVEVEVTTLDELIDRCKLEHIDVVKIDVEGSELDVLQGGHQTLERNPNAVILMDLHPQLGVDPVGLGEAISGHGLRVFDIRNPRDEIALPEAAAGEILLRR